jgi:beta-lactamase regulating signal transducer with metallopeptidase domain
MDMLNHLVDVLLMRFIWTSIQAVLLIGAVYLLGRLLPGLSAAMRCMLWWLVGMQLLLGLLWSAPVKLPLLSPPSVSAPIESGQPSATYIVATTPATVRRVVIPTPSPPVMSWRAGMATLWLAALLMQLILALRQWRHTQRVLRESQPLHDNSLRALCTQQARMLGLRTCPQLRASEAIASPQVIGLWQPTVLLPANHALTAEEAAMAMAHELAHLRRGDLWLGWVPAIARRLFFFHPLVVWAMREYALNREAACDAQVLQHDHAAPQDYGRLLLRLGVAHPIHSGLAGASPSFHNLKRRLTMLQQTVNHPQSRTRGWLLVALIALVGVLPYRVTAASGKHGDAAPITTGMAVAAPLPPMAPLPPAPPMNASSAPPPMAPLPPPPPPPPPHDSGFSARHVDISTTGHTNTGFALFDGDSITINGSDADAEAARKLRGSNKSLLWFRRGNDAYLIRDKALLERASRIYAPVTALARQQGELAGDQGGAAGLQAGLAAQDAAFAQEHAAMAQQQAEMATRVATRAAATSNTDARQSELDAQQRQMDEAQSRLDQRHALEQLQSQFEKQRQAIGRKQQQAEQAAAQAMGQLLDEALAKGLAQKASLR